MLSLVELKNWCENDFIKRNGGFFPKEIDTWYEKVNKTHAKSRTLLGEEGIIQHKFNIEGCQKPLNLDVNRALIDKIKEVAPSFLPQFGYTDEIFKFPNINDGNHSSERLSKKILTHIRSYGTMGECRTLDKLISTLGEAWSKCKTIEEEVTVTLSTTHKAFILLGHYGPDFDSCWRQGSDKTRHKYALAQSPETFIMSISKFDNRVKRELNVARCCGFFSQDLSTMNLMNYYFLPGFLEANGIHCMELMAKHIFKKPIRLIEDLVILDGGVWHNPYGNWSFTTIKDEVDLQSQILYSDFSDIDSSRCEKCGRTCNTPSDIYSVDDRNICYICVDKAQRCAISQKLTYKPMVQFINEYGEMMYALPTIVLGLPICEKCGERTQQTWEISGSLYCRRCHDQCCQECDGCSYLFESNELEETESGIYCSECVENPQDCILTED